MKLPLFIVISLALASIAFCSSSFFGEPDETNYEKIAHAITRRTAKKIELEKSLKLMGTGGGMLGDIYMMAMSFKYKQEVDIKKARELLVYCVQEYLTAINSDEKVRPYLHNYPFTPKNIEIRIFFSTPNNGDVTIGSLCCAGAIEGSVDYDIKNAATGRLETVHEETFEQAVKLAQADQPNK